MVIPHRRERALLIRALGALGDVRVLVVDDTDEGLDLDVPKLRLGGGQGFATAANAGLAAVSTPYALLLNDDAVPLHDCLPRLARVSGLCGPVLLGPNGVESAGLSVARWGRVRQITSVPGVDQPVAALSGCCLWMPSSLRFDTRFRHGFEDVELCRRVGGARIVAHARCWHEGGATISRSSPQAQRFAVAGQLRLFPGWRAAPVIALAVAQVLRETPTAPVPRLRAVYEGWRDVSVESSA